MIGVNFQPGQSGENGQNGNGNARPGSGVQEAIKVLSLRLPKVVGAQASASLPLLTSQGSGGNPRVDSVVNQVLARVMPQGQPQQAPSGMGASAPTFSGAGGGSPMTPNWPMPQGDRPQPPWGSGPMPRVVVDSPSGQPPRWPGQAQLDGGGGPPPGMIAPLPPNLQFPTAPPSPSPMSPSWPQIGQGLGGFSGYPSPSPREDEYF